MAWRTPRYPPTVYFTDRGIEELASRRGAEEVSGLARRAAENIRRPQPRVRGADRPSGDLVGATRRRRRGLTHVTDSSHDSDRPTFGMGPAYPSSHTRFDDGAGTRQATSASPARSGEPGARVAAGGGGDPLGEPSTPGRTSHPPRSSPSPAAVRDLGMVFVGASTTAAGYGARRASAGSAGSWHGRSIPTSI